MSVFETKLEQKPTVEKAAGEVPLPRYAYPTPLGYDGVIRPFMTPAEMNCDNYEPPKMGVENLMPRRKGHHY